MSAGVFGFKEIVDQSDRMHKWIEMPADNPITQDGERENENGFFFLFVRKIIYRHFALMTSRCIFETIRDVADRQ